MRRRGFTLIELMIVIAIIAIIAAIAIPGLLRSRVGANEISAISTLKTFTAGEEQFRSSCCVDQDSNGIGEYGWIVELSGSGNYRVVGGNCQNAPFIPATFNGDCSQKSGYFFTVYLATDAYVWSNIYAAAGVADSGSGTWGVCEENFLAYAWPSVYGKSGNRVFALSAQGQIMQTANGSTATPIQGTGNVPEADAALSGGVATAPFVVGGDVGGDADIPKPWAPIG